MRLKRAVRVTLLRMSVIQPELFPELGLRFFSVPLADKDADADSYPHAHADADGPSLKRIALSQQRRSVRREYGFLLATASHDRSVPAESVRLQRYCINHSVSDTLVRVAGRQLPDVVHAGRVVLRRELRRHSAVCIPLPMQPIGDRVGHRPLREQLSLYRRFFRLSRRDYLFSDSVDDAPAKPVAAAAVLLISETRVVQRALHADQRRWDVPSAAMLDRRDDMQQSYGRLRDRILCLQSVNAGMGVPSLSFRNQL